METNMKNLKRLATAVVLTLVLGLTTFAGETLTPPCAPPEPGETLTPPCASGTVAPGAPATPGTPFSNAVDMSSVAEIALTVMQSALALF